MRKHLRIAWICVLIACIGVSAAGVVLSPVPVYQSSAFAEWYPCEGHGCGCVSAEMCRSHCCCFGEHARTMKAPRPAAKSHASGNAGSAFGVTVQSANCSGRLGWVMGVGLAWDVASAQPPRVVMGRSDERIIEENDLYTDLATVGLDPPPPRC